ncbi:hypothetical protein TDB9533_03875 [Thalassocella blandensis]|nr:hypothetical protein TDB9533_03875 [Thalassocella blandensis]
MGYVTFPFKADDIDDCLSLVNFDEGGYALGSNSFWHGGIHLSLSENTQAIICPADGHIVAHRTMKKRTKGKCSVEIDDQGNKISHEKDEDIDSSFSFVLTKHSLITPNEESINYFILHMHLLCYENYTDQHKANPPSYLHGNVQHFVNKSEDDGGSLVGKGVNLRAAPHSKQNNVLTVVPADTEFLFKTAGLYDHQTPAGYQEIVIPNPKCFSIENASVPMGFRQGVLRLLPDAPYYNEHGLLYKAKIVRAQDGRMGVPLFVGGYHVGDLQIGQEIYLFEEPSCEGEFSIILDNITHVIDVDADGEITWNSVIDAIYNSSNLYTPDSDDIIPLADVLCEMNLDVENESVTAHIKVRGADISGKTGQVALIPEKLYNFTVNTFEDNQCGIPAYDTQSDAHLINIPFATKISLVNGVTVQELIQETKQAIKPLTLQQASEGFMYCGKGYVKRVINELTGTFDKVQTFDPPIEVSSGEVIGFPGDHIQQNSVHMELWLESIDFFSNNKADKLLEPFVSLPAGMKAKTMKVEKRKGKTVELTIPAKTRLKSLSMTTAEKSEDADLRKIQFDGKAYYTKRANLGSWKAKIKRYVLSTTEDKVISAYDAHPTLQTEFVSYEDGELPSALDLKEIPPVTVINEKNYYPVQVASSTKENSSESATSQNYFIPEKDLDALRLNFYDWQRFFTKELAADLGIEASGKFESIDDIKNAVSQKYQQACDSDKMEAQPAYQKQHPLSHLLIEAGNDWSKAYKKESNWKPEVIDHIWKQGQVSSLEEEMGMTKDKLEKVFDQTIQPYVDGISFYDEIQGKVCNLPDKSAVWHAHPIRFLDHIARFYNSGRAPWMEIACAEAVRAKGCVEGKEPLLSMATAYLRFTGNTASPDDDESGQWCAAFLSWCIDKAGFTVAPQKWKRANSQQFRLLPETFKKIDQPIYGALAVYTKHTDSSRGHIGFVYGKTQNGKLILLGGNQQDMIRCSAYGMKTKSKFFNGYYVPIDYKVSAADYLTPDDVNYKNSEDANNNIGITTTGEDNDKTN